MASPIVSQSVYSPVVPAGSPPKPHASVYEIITNQILAELERGDVPWRKPWRTLPPANLISKRPYRGINVFLLGFAGYGSQYWLTFNQAKQLGGNVRRGEHGTKLRKSTQPEDSLLTRENGEPIHDLRRTWAAMTAEAKLPGLLLHDFRRSAVRNMIRRGVPQKTAREISGHKTDSVFNRYNIVSEADLQDAARKIEAGAKAVIHSSFTVEPEGLSNEGRQKEQKPIQSVS